MKRVLVKYGGSALESRGDRDRLMADLAAAHDDQTQLLVIHGGGPQASKLARRLGHEPTFKSGRRVTDAAMLEVVVMALIGKVGADLLSAALSAGLPAIAMAAASGGFVVGKRRPPRQVAGEQAPIDFGWVADVVSVDPQPIEHLWSGGYVPLISSPVIDASGQLLNLNADSLVRAVSATLRFDDVIYVVDVGGVFGDLSQPQSHIPKLHPDDIESLIDRGIVQGGMIAKLDEIGQMVRTHVARAWIVGAADDAPVSAALHGAPARRTLIER